MVKFADIGTLIWLIIAVMVVVAKSWSKFQKPIDDATPESREDAPPAVPVQRRPTMRAGPRPMPPQRPRPQSSPARAVPPSARTAERTARPPVGTPPWRGEWKVDPEQIRRFMEQLSGRPVPPEPVQPQPPSPPPVARQPVRRAALPTSPPELVTPEPVPAEAAAEPVKASVPEPAPATTSRASQWAEALRDRQNIRNIIISAEIIGPPKALRS